MDLKTPVSMLQEYLIKKGCVPNFKVIANGNGAHNPTFIYLVSALGESAQGTGPSKKAAKHAAAEALLAKLSSDVIYRDVVDNPYADVPQENAVGALQDFCLTYETCVPRYETTEACRTSKTFITKCFLNEFSTTGEGHTKKSSKHTAAFLMLKKIKEVVSKNGVQKATSPSNVEKQHKAVERLCEKVQKDLVFSSKKSRIPIDKDYSKLFQSEVYNNSKQWNYLKNNSVNNIAEPVSFFKELMSQLSLPWETFKIQLKASCTDKMSCILIKEIDNATFFGRGPTEDNAFEEAVLSALKWFFVMATD